MGVELGPAGEISNVKGFPPAPPDGSKGLPNDVGTPPKFGLKSSPGDPPPNPKLLAKLWKKLPAELSPPCCGSPIELGSSWGLVGGPIR